MDIITHMSDNIKSPLPYIFPLNGDTTDSQIHFSYDFVFGKKEFTYSYSKDENMNLIYEKIVIDKTEVFSYDYQTNKIFNRLPEVSNINEDILKRRNLKNSVIKSLYGFSSSLPDDSPIKLLYEFADEMLWFRSLSNYEFMGNTSSIDNIEAYIVSSKELFDGFENFLHACGLNYKLKIVDSLPNKRIYACFSNKEYPLFEISSTGTKSLWLFYYWMNRCKGHISFLYLDEFDAYYHSDLSKSILNFVNKEDAFQSVLTTHNAYLADNEIMRPDCYMFLKDGQIKSFADSTNRIIRRGNSLEHMVLTDDFK